MSIRARIRAGVVVLIAAGVALIGAAFAGVRYTSQPSFCASCHEMQSVHRGWSKGSHATTGCHDCHVDHTIKGQVLAKVNGLRQVYMHFTTTVDMERVTAPPVPPHRCVRCHDMASEEKLGPRIVAAHRKHTEARLECMVCHFTSGHSRELFAGFKHDSCQECHSTAPTGQPNSYLRKPPCTRERTDE